MVAGLGEPAERLARRWPPGGGRGSSGSGEQTGRPGQHAGAQAHWVLGEGLGVLERHREYTKRGAHRGGIYGGRRRAQCSRAWKGTTTFIGEHKAVGCFLARQGNPIAVVSRHGRSTAGSGRRRATAMGQWRRASGGVWPRHARHVGRGYEARMAVQRKEQGPWRADRRTEACLGVRAQRGGVQRRVGARCATSRAWARTPGASVLYHLI
jgi:hypothetical protein